MLSSFLIELAQVDAGMLKYSYSLQSASALYVAMRTFGEGSVHDLMSLMAALTVPSDDCKDL